MKGIYIIAIAFLAFSIEIAAKKYAWKYGVWEGDIPTTCPSPTSNETVHLAHETDCTKFYQCFGKKYLQPCPLKEKGDPYTRLHFNRREMVCDWPRRAGCQDCPLKDKNGNWPVSKIPHEQDPCGKYYLCINGEKHLQQCPPNKCFSRTCQDCVVNREGGQCNPGNDDNCPKGKKIPHECNCNLYYECVNGGYVRSSCANGLHFSPRIGDCTTPDKSGCVPPF